MTLKLNYQLDDMRTKCVAHSSALADQIVSANGGRPVVLLGIQRRGIPMAQRMAKTICGDRPDISPQMGILDINLYRDDLTKVATQPVVRRTEIPAGHRRQRRHSRRRRSLHRPYRRRGAAAL